MPNNQPTKEELLLGSFKNCLYMVWKYLNLPEPTEAQYEICDFLQNSPKRAIIEAFRGIGKSWITSVFVLWKLRSNPNLKILVVSASQQRANDFSSFCHKLMQEIPFFQCLYPNKDQRDSVISFDVRGARPAHMPSVKSLGVMGQLVGSRADLIIADDIETNQNSLTEDAREKLIHTVGEFNSILTPKEDSSIVFLGTPQSAESIYNHLRSNAGYRAFIIPARYPSAEEMSIYGDSLALYIYTKIMNNYTMVGKSTDPKRFSDLELMEREASLGKSAFRLQFMLDTSLSDALRYPLKTSDAIIMSLDVNKAPINLSYGSSNELQIKDIPNVGFQGDRFYRPFFVDKEFSSYEGAVMAVDPSGRGSDLTGYAVVKQLHGKLFVTDAGGLPGGYDEITLVQLAKIAKDNRVKFIVIESNFGDSMFSQLLKPILGRIYPCSLEDVRHSTQKELRIISTLEPLLNKHKLIFDEQVVRNDLKRVEDQNEIKHSLFYQLTHITKDRGSLKHDDCLDALAMACNYWLTSMARDEEKATEDWHERMIEEDLQRFLDGAFFVRDGSGDRFEFD